ncbi:ATR interacting protein [Phyllostomus discolor]|uniref:ATR interacting protein n=1 Tax=Phyllostomus discolor TaxID=89673 RepID=A0A834E069_9CHIR|nr:ATR interacting protein [Phyllostomus discolor]
MAGAPAPGSRRRSGPQAPSPGPPPSIRQPPSKRPRGFPAAAALDPEDPFGPHEDFTADDLEELDILASQALSHCPFAARDVSSAHNVPRLDGMPKNPTGKSRESVPVKDNFELELLQAQYKELKEKMKAMEEEVLIKNGEIKILRDSLHQTESVVEEQRRSHYFLEQEKAQALSDKEKEFSKKLQSLQSELQFKDAEMNELRTKLQSSERANKLAVPCTSHGSPRKSPSVVPKPEACSPQLGKPSFPTKESFSANTSLPQPCQTEPGCKALAGREENKTHSLGGDPVKQEESPQKCLVNSLMQTSNTRGSILINLLLQQPLTPGSSVGLCHLLSSGSEAPTGTLSQPLGFGSILPGISSLRTTGSRDGPLPLSALREAQNLALTGLNMIARDEGSCDRDPAEGGRRAFPLCRFPGAVHLLPLLQLFIGVHCQALQDSSLSVAKRSGAPGDSPARASRVSPRAEASAEDTLSQLEPLCVASLSVLQHLVCHSGAVVGLLLSGAGAGSAAASEGDPSLACPGAGASDPGGLADHQGQHPLLKMLVRLLTLSSAAPGHLQANVLSQCLQVLVKSAENSPLDLLPRLQSVFPALPRCLSPETPLPSVLLTVQLLSLLVDHEELVPQLCSHSEGCLLLLLYMYITSRPDRAASDRQWLQLEQEAVWLLAKLGVQSPSSPVTGSNCQCNVEVVRVLTVVLHRQWLTVRRAGRAPGTEQRKRTVRCLRDAVLLLHGLSQKDKLFAVHCVEVLHQYDQAMPGVSTLIRGLPDVTDCEEAALDDLCAAETEAEDPEMDCG